jgi:hypothetical protein
MPPTVTSEKLGCARSHATKLWVAERPARPFAEPSRSHDGEYRNCRSVAQVRLERALRGDHLVHFSTGQSTSSI